MDFPFSPITYSTFQSQTILCLCTSLQYIIIQFSFSPPLGTSLEFHLPRHSRQVFLLAYRANSKQQITLRPLDFKGPSQLKRWWYLKSAVVWITCCQGCIVTSRYRNAVISLRQFLGVWGREFWRRLELHELVNSQPVPYHINRFDCRPKLYQRCTDFSCYFITIYLSVASHVKYFWHRKIYFADWLRLQFAQR